MEVDERIITSDARLGGWRGSIVKWNDDLYRLAIYSSSGKLDCDSWAHSIRSAKIVFGKYLDIKKVKWIK